MFFLSRKANKLSALTAACQFVPHGGFIVQRRSAGSSSRYRRSIQAAERGKSVALALYPVHFKRAVNSPRVLAVMPAVVKWVPQ